MNRPEGSARQRLLSADASAADGVVRVNLPTLEPRLGE
jgi:hypothetical protein